MVTALGSSVVVAADESLEDSAGTVYSLPSDSAAEVVDVLVPEDDDVSVVCEFFASTGS